MMVVDTNVQWHKVATHYAPENAVVVVLCCKRDIKSSVKAGDVEKLMKVLAWASKRARTRLITDRKRNRLSKTSSRAETKTAKQKRSKSWTGFSGF